MLGRASSPQDRGEPGARLAARRRLRRRRVLIAFGVLLCILAGVLVWGLQQDSVRISQITVYGADASFAAYARVEMEGSYLGLVPRDSTFFYPASHIRSAIIAEYPSIAAVSLFRNGFTGLSIKIHDRVAIARWCGSTSSPQAASSEEQCYVFDASGYLYAAAPEKTLNTFALYAPLVGDTLEPLRATIARAAQLPAALDFARQLDTLGGTVTQVILRDDEVDDMLASGTRITYVLGREQDAFTALISARENMNLADGSLEYVDLRFDGKVYLKKKVDSKQKTVNSQ